MVGLYWHYETNVDLRNNAQSEPGKGKAATRIADASDPSTDPKRGGKGSHNDTGKGLTEADLNAPQGRPPKVMKQNVDIRLTKPDESPNNSYTYDHYTSYWRYHEASRIARKQTSGNDCDTPAVRGISNVRLPNWRGAMAWGFASKPSGKGAAPAAMDREEENNLAKKKRGWKSMVGPKELFTAKDQTSPTFKIRLEIGIVTSFCALYGGLQTKRRPRR